MSFRVLLVAAGCAFVAGCMPPSWGAGALLHPSRSQVQKRPTRAVEEVDIQGQGVKLRAWWFRAEGQRRGTIVYLHGVADNRGSSISIAERFVPQGFDVLAYDSRAHGDSTGDACTYGFYEKRDLMRVLDNVDARPIIVIGASLGAAVAMQAAADDDRIDLVVAAATFSDLRTVANERAPFFASKANIDEALKIAEQRGSFKVNEVSPVLAADRVGVPVLVIHGEMDNETPPEHSRRVHAALRTSKRLIIVPNAGHNDCLTPQVWLEIERWLAAALKGKRAG